MEVLKSASCFLGGDAFDEALGALVERKLREQEDVELPSTEAIAYRLKLKGEEIKKAFATEQGQSISVEFVQGDDCFDLEIAREEFEAACRDRRLFDRFFEFVSDVLRDFPAALRLDGIETVGGNMYIARLGRELLHAVQDRGLEVQKVGSTMSKQEACARGCALFARKALVEKKIVCGAVDVLVNDPQNDVKLTMPLFGCRSDTVRRGDFAIVTEDAPQGGYDHDCRLNKRKKGESKGARFSAKASRSSRTSSRSARNRTARRKSSTSCRSRCTCCRAFWRPRRTARSTAREPSRTCSSCERRSGCRRRRAACPSRRSWRASGPCRTAWSSGSGG